MFDGNTFAFVMPYYIYNRPDTKRIFDEAVESVIRQTDENWFLIIVEDCCPDEEIRDYPNKYIGGADGRIMILHNKMNLGAGESRNVGINYAHSLGIRYIIFLDDDDVSHPDRVKKAREAFKDPDVNVLYSPIYVIDENDERTPREEICASMLEIIDGYDMEPVEGENAFIRIGIERNCLCVPSAMAVRTELALLEKFGTQKVSDDVHTTLRYSAHPGKFAYIPDTPTGYRIFRNTGSHCRSKYPDFYKIKAAADTDGFYKAIDIALTFGTIDPAMIPSYKADFHRRLAISMKNGNELEEAEHQLQLADSFDKEKMAV